MWAARGTGEDAVLYTVRWQYCVGLRFMMPLDFINKVCESCWTLMEARLKEAID